MADVDPTAIVRGEVELGEGVHVGPGCVLDGTLGPVSVGEGTKLVGGVWLYGPLTIGGGNTIYPFTCIGFAPQAIAFDPSRPGPGTSIGEGNVFREGFTVHRAMTDKGPTTIGSHNYFMNQSHVGHDTRIADHCTFAASAMTGGHSIVDERAVFGGHSAVAQFTRIGRGAMISGCVATGFDLPPFFTLTGINVAGTVNMVGMRRQGMPHDQIDDVRWVYKTLYRHNLPPPAALEALRERGDRPMVAEYIAFIESSKHGVCRGHEQVRRPKDH